MQTLASGQISKDPEWKLLSFYAAWRIRQRLQGAAKGVSWVKSDKIQTRTQKFWPCSYHLVHCRNSHLIFLKGPGILLNGAWYGSPPPHLQFILLLLQLWISPHDCVVSRGNGNTQLSGSQWEAAWSPALVGCLPPGGVTVFAHPQLGSRLRPSRAQLGHEAHNSNSHHLLITKGIWYASF